VAEGHINIESVFASILSQEIAKIYLQNPSSQGRFMRAYTYPIGGDSISASRGVGLFIARRAFGDAFVRIDRTMSHAFLLVTINAI